MGWISFRNLAEVFRCDMLNFARESGVFDLKDLRFYPVGHFNAVCTYTSAIKIKKKTLYEGSVSVKKINIDHVW